MAGEAFADNGAGGGVESREQAEGSVTRVVMRAPLDLAWAHGQKRLGSIERLNLAFFVDAQDNGAVGRRKVKADDVAHFFDEQGISRELEGLGAMRLKAFQIRWIVEGANPTALANERKLQCVASRGVASSVRRTISATSSSPIWRGAPGRGSS